MKKSILFTASFLLAQFSFAQPTAWNSRGVGGGGAVYSPSINPANPAEIYLSCDMAVLHHTVDSGKNWATVPFTKLIGNRFSEVQFTSDQNVHYVLSQNQYSTAYIPHISNDAGQSWTSISSASFGISGTFRLFAHPAFSNILVVSDYDEIFFSKNSGGSYSSIYSTTPFVHLAGVFFDNENIYVSTNKGILISNDTGNTWQSFAPYSAMGITDTQEEVVSFRGAKQGSLLRFIAVTLVTSGFTPKTFSNDLVYFRDIYKMDYNTATVWNSIKSNFQNAAPSNKAYNIAMKNDEPQIFYIGGSAKVPDNASGITLGTVFKTTDGGNTFSNTFLNSGYTTNANIFTGWQGSNSGGVWNQHRWNAVNTTEGITVSQSDINYLIRSDKSNVYVSTDGGNTWQQRYVNSSYQHSPNTLINQSDTYQDNGLHTTAVYWLTWLDSTKIFASFADLLAIRSDDGGSSWSFNYSGLDSQKINDASMFVKHGSGTLYAVTGDIPGSNGDYTDARIMMTNAGRISFSNDNGQNWQVFKSFGRPVLSIDFNPNDTSEMYVTVASEIGGSGGIYKFSDRNNANSIQQLAAPPRTENRAGFIKVLNTDTLVCIYTVRDAGGNSYTTSSGVFYSTDDGQTWQDRTAAAMQKDIRSITIDPNDATQNTWWVCAGMFSQAGGKGLYKTTDRGVNWTLVNNTLNSLSCTFHPTLANTLYLCTENDGLYYVTNTDQPAPAFTFDVNYPFKRPQRVFFNPYNVNEVWVASFGNGLRVGTTSLVAIKEFSREERNEVLVYPNPSGGQFAIRNLQFAISELKIYDVTGKMVFFHKLQTTNYELDLKDLPSGMYFYQLLNRKQALATGKIAIE